MKPKQAVRETLTPRVMQYWVLKDMPLYIRVISSTRFQVLMANSIKMTAFCDTAPCRSRPTFQRCVLSLSSGHCHIALGYHYHHSLSNIYRFVGLQEQLEMSRKPLIFMCFHEIPQMTSTLLVFLLFMSTG
jgi:hypothetical protein